jgi:sulfate transport system ATP-binding protein
VVLHVHTAGSMIRLELEQPGGGQPIAVEVSREVYERLRPERGERLFLRPRRMRVFLSGNGRAPSEFDYQI